MSIRIILLLLFALPGAVLADAGSGDFMGYKLGAKYLRSSTTAQQVTTTGNLLITAEQPVKPDDIGEVTLLTTPVTLTIGNITASQWFATEAEARDFARKYFNLLRTKYPDWPFGWEVMDPQMNIVEVSLRQAAVNLRLWLAKDSRSAKTPWRISLTLGWLPDSTPEQAWRATSSNEQIALQQSVRKQTLQDADLRGL